MNNSEKASLFALLGRCFISEMDVKALNFMLSAPILQVLEKVSPGISKYMHEAEWDDSRIEQLASDYCHLFILPGKAHISLKMSHWVKDNGPVDTSVLENLISEMDFDFDSLKISKTPTDQLGVLLYFLSNVLLSEDEKVYSMADELESRVLFWIPSFDAKLRESSENPFYLACGKLLTELVDF